MITRIVRLAKAYWKLVKNPSPTDYDGEQW